MKLLTGYGRPLYFFVYFFCLVKFTFISERGVIAAEPDANQEPCYHFNRFLMIPRRIRIDSTGPKHLVGTDVEVLGEIPYHSEWRERLEKKVGPLYETKSGGFRYFIISRRGKNWAVLVDKKIKKPHARSKFWVRAVSNDLKELLPKEFFAKTRDSNDKRSTNPSWVPAKDPPESP